MKIIFSLRFSTTTEKAVISISTERNGELTSTSGKWLPNQDGDECGYSVSTGYIIGGATAARGEFPFAVLLGYKNHYIKDPNAKLYRCGGSLINRKYVLTAAHW